jgi:hypothetical protein
VQRTGVLVAFLAAAFLSNSIARKEPTVYFTSPCTCKNDHMSDRKKAEWMGREHSILIHLPPLATVALGLEK